MEDGSTTEIGLIGNEGMIGLPSILGGQRSPSRAIVQIAGDSIRLEARTLQQEFKQSETLPKNWV